MAGAPHHIKSWEAFLHLSRYSRMPCRTPRACCHNTACPRKNPSGSALIFVGGALRSTMAARTVTRLCPLSPRLPDGLPRTHVFLHPRPGQKALALAASFDTLAALSFASARRQEQHQAGRLLSRPPPEISSGEHKKELEHSSIATSTRALQDFTAHDIPQQNLFSLRTTRNLSKNHDLALTS